MARKSSGRKLRSKRGRKEKLMANMAFASSSVDFLAPNNACGQTLLQLVSRGHAIIAEHLRLSDFVPSIFSKEGYDTGGKSSNTASLNAATTAKYRELICDFSYFKICEQFEAKVEGNPAMQDLDEEMRENYLDILTRFYLAFESVYRYAIDLERYIEDLEEGTFIQQTVETVLMNVEGKQLMAEAIYLLGTMLLVVDSEIEGPVRERLLVSFYRYSSRSASFGAHIDDVCRLFRDTGKTKGKRPPNYPENYFQRVRLNKTALTMVVGRLRSDDIYSQMSAFPLPDHRSTALAPQAAMLYICLYFLPQVLINETSVMREIVDKYFSDNWVINTYMGHVVNLMEAWEPYKAAKLALASVHTPANVKMLADRHLRELQDVNSGLVKFLTEGTLTKEFILDTTNKILAAIRRCNVTLRWLMLHSMPIRPEWESVKKCNQLRDALVSEPRFGVQSVFALLLNSAQFELIVKEKFREMLSERQKECTALRQDISERMNELAEVFSGTKPLSRVPKNEKLRLWFVDIGGQIDQLTFDDVLSTGRKLVQLMRSLEEVQEFYSLDVNVQIRQFLAEIRQVMHQLLRTLSMKEDTLVQIQTICDISFAWEIIENYTDSMQKGIKKDATMASRLRAVFIKLSSCLDLPLLRIQQANSPDLVSVSQFYSRLLVLYIRRVLHVIPETVFSLLAQIVQLQTSKIEEMPTRLDKTKLKEYAKLDERYEVARLTHAISVLTEGVLMMKVTLVGAIRVDPKQLLEDGIRKELVQRIATAMHSLLIFNMKGKQQPGLQTKLDALAIQIDGYRRSFEYISDYIGLPGLKIWQEEFTRIVNYNVEQECNGFLRRKVQDWESVYQSKLIPIPRFAPVDNNASFVGRLATEIMKETDPKTTTYIHAVATWYDTKTHKELINPQLFKMLLRAVGNIGTAGLDRLYCFMVVHYLQQWSQMYAGIMANVDMNTAVDAALKAVGDRGRAVDQPAKVYSNLITKFSKNLAPLCDALLKVGHMQILRLHISRELNTVCKFQSKLLEHVLQTLNSVVVADIRARAAELQSEDENALLYELTTYLEAVGITDPLQKLYITPATIPNLEFICFLLVLIQVPKLAYVKNVGLISRKPTDAVDGVPFVIGMLTLLRQFGSSTVHSFIQFIGQLLNSFVHNALSSKTEIPNDASVLMKFVLELTSFANMSIKELGEHVPQILLDQHQILF